MGPPTLPPLAPPAPSEQPSPYDEEVRETNHLHYVLISLHVNYHPNSDAM